MIEGSDFELFLIEVSRSIFNDDGGTDVMTVDPVSRMWRSGPFI